MAQRPLAPHVQAAISAAAQPRMSATPAAKPAPAPHVQAAVARTVQPKPAAPEVRRPVPHVQAALSPAAQPRTAPLQPRPVAPHVQAAVVQPRSAVPSSPSRQAAAHVRASVAAIQPKSQNGVIQQVKFRVTISGSQKVVDSKKIIKDSSKYAESRSVYNALKAISSGQEYNIRSLNPETGRQKVTKRLPTDKEKEEAAEALKELNKSKEVQKRLKSKKKTEEKNARLQEVGKKVKELSGQITEDELKKGKLLGVVGRRASLKALTSYKSTQEFKDNVMLIESQTDASTPILTDQTPFRVVESVLESKVAPKTLDFGTHTFWFPYKESDNTPKPPSIQINMGSTSSYHAMNNTKTSKKDAGDRLLNVLEVARDRDSAMSEYLKEDMRRKNILPLDELHSDMKNTAYQEYKKETKDKFPDEVSRVQKASAWFNLELSLSKRGDLEIGVPVTNKKTGKPRPLTTPKNLKRKLDSYLEDVKEPKTRKKRKVELLKEGQRIVRAITEEDFSSDSEGDVSDTDLF